MDASDDVELFEDQFSINYDEVQHRIELPFFKWFSFSFI